MKRGIFCLCLVVIAALGAGCGSGTSQKDDQTGTVVDVDLTQMSSTMVYSEVYNIMTEPEEYEGKTIKVNGLLTKYTDKKSGKNYFSCINQDATKCCAQGLEFETTRDFSYPEDYPEEGEEITIIGTFEMYTEDEVEYGTLRNAIIVT